MLAQQSVLRIHYVRFRARAFEKLQVELVARKKYAQIKAFLWSRHCHT